MATIHKLSVISLLVTSLGGAAAAQDDTFDAVRNRYRQIRSVHLTATANVVRRPDVESSAVVRGNMKVEYLASPRGYWMNCSSDPSLGLVDDMELAFDGGQWQLLQVSKRELGLSTQPNRANPLTCPNPLFLMVEYAGPPPTGCKACSVALQDLWNTDSATVQPTGRLSGTARTYSIRDRDPKSARRFDVTVEQKGGSVVPTILVEFYPSGRPSSEVRASKFVTTAVGFLPTQVVIRSFEDVESKQAADVVTYQIDSLSINRKVDERRFLIDWSAADMVYDMDSGEYVVHPHRDEMNAALRRAKARAEAKPLLPQ